MGVRRVEPEHFIAPSPPHEGAGTGQKAVQSL